MTLSNTSVSGVTLTISGNNNVVKYVTLQGMNTSTTAGVLVFGASTGNVVDYCDIRDVPATGTPTIGIYSASASTNTISNSNIFNYYHVSAGSKGVFLGANTTGWTISENSFYNTGASERNYTGGIVSAIYIDNASGNGFSIQNNSIGGQQALCGGNKDLMGLSTAGSASGLFYKAIYLNVGATSATSVQGNTIQNLAIVTGAGINTSTTDNTALVTINNGAVNFGTITGNTIGSQSQIGSITYNDVNNAAKQSYFFGIRIAGSTGIVNIKNNSIGGIKMVDNSYITGSLNFNIINIEGTRTTDAIKIEANTIGNSSVGITDGTQMSLQNMLYKLGSTACSRGTKAINSGASGSVIIKDNLIANIYGSNVANAGIAVLSLGGSASYTVNGNTLRDFISASQGGNNDGNNQKWNNSIIYYNGSNTKANVLIYGNTLANLTVTNTSAYSNYLDAITLFTSATGQGATIYNNRIHNIYPTGSNAGYVVSSGIRTTTTAGVIASIYNNMIRLGYDKSGTTVTTSAEFRGISEMVNGTVDAVFNTVLIGGTGVVAATKSSYGYYSTITSSAARLIENNIFQNDRAGSSGKHYAIRLANITNTTCDYNNLVSASGYIANWNGTDKALFGDWQGAASGLDANSLNIQPVYAGATAVIPDLHIYTGGGFVTSALAGTNMVSTTPNTDFDGDARTNYTMGADDNGISVLVATPAEFAALNTTISTAQTLYNAAVEGTIPGQYNASKATFLSAIQAAQAVASNVNSTSVEVNNANTALTAAYNTFNSSLVPPAGSESDFAALASIIQNAQSVYDATIAKEGTNLGQYTASNRTTLLNAISATQTVYNYQYSSTEQLTSVGIALTDAVKTFKNSINVNTSALTTGGYYYIYITDNDGTRYFLTDVNPTVEATAGNGVQPINFQTKLTGSDDDYQLFKFTLDEAKGRYRIDGKYRVDAAYTNTYVAEGCVFGKNAYDNSWNTMKVSYNGTKYAIERAEKTTGFWLPSNYASLATINVTGENLYDNIVFNIVSVNDFTTDVHPIVDNSTISVLNHQLNIQSNTDISKVLIYDFSGKIVKSVTSGFNNISLNNGTYIVKIVNSQSSDIYKIMVK